MPKATLVVPAEQGECNQWFAWLQCIVIAVICMNSVHQGVSPLITVGDK